MTDLIDKIKDRARELGFDDVAVTSAQLSHNTGKNLESYVKREHHGQMAWLAETLTRRKSPKLMWPRAKTAIVVATNYGPELDPMARLKQKSDGIISVYALNRDYHDVTKGKLKQLAGWFAGQTGNEVKVFVDTAPLMEKPLAEKSGIGWQGKHTNLVSREFGSWLFLGVILTDLEIIADEPSQNHCGNCNACLEACPTNAFARAHEIDARRCLSYLTIEFNGHIDREFRKAMGNRIYGCDDCLAVCPWNKFAQLGREAKLQARNKFIDPPLADLADLDDRAFREFFSASPVKRSGRDRFVRNVMIAIGNSGNRALAQKAKSRLDDESPLVRAMAVWACSRLLTGFEFSHLKNQFVKLETDDAVRIEWERGP